MKETSMILDRLLVIKLDATIWGGRKKLRKEDLILADGSVLPPEELASLGSKKIADPQELAVFNRLKKEAERVCLKAGTRFLGGFAVPEGSIGAIRDELDRIVLSFQAAKDDFLARYDQSVEDWVARHPDFSEAIRNAVEPVEAVAASLKLDYIVFRVAEPDASGPAASADESLGRKVGALSDTLFREVAQEANELLEDSLLGRATATRKTLNPVKRIRDKLDGLAFLDHRVQPVVETLDDMLGRVPKTGPLTGAFLQELLATALLLSDPDKIKRHGDGLLRVDELLPAPPAGEAAEVPDDLFVALDAGLDPDDETEAAPEAPEELEALEPADAGDFWF